MLGEGIESVLYCALWHAGLSCVGAGEHRASTQQSVTATMLIVQGDIQKKRSPAKRGRRVASFDLSFELHQICLYLCSYTVNTVPKTEGSAMKKGLILGADSSGNLHFHLGPDL